MLFATEASFESKNVAKEVAIASEWEKPILPVYLERVQVPDTLHYQLAGIQHVELFAEREEEAFNGMLGALHTIGVAINENIEIKPSSMATHHAPFIPKKQPKSKKPMIIGLATLAITGLSLPLKFSENTKKKGYSIKISPANGSATRIALVPFRNIGPQQKDTFLAECMHEEIDAMSPWPPN